MADRNLELDFLFLVVSSFTTHSAFLCTSNLSANLPILSKHSFSYHIDLIQKAWHSIFAKTDSNDPLIMYVFQQHKTSPCPPESTQDPIHGHLGFRNSLMAFGLCGRRGTMLLVYACSAGF